MTPYQLIEDKSLKQDAINFKNATAYRFVISAHLLKELFYVLSISVENRLNPTLEQVQVPQKKLHMVGIMNTVKCWAAMEN